MTTETDTLPYTVFVIKRRTSSLYPFPLSARLPPIGSTMLASIELHEPPVHNLRDIPLAQSIQVLSHSPTTAAECTDPSPPRYHRTHRVDVRPLTRLLIASADHPTIHALPSRSHQRPTEGVVDMWPFGVSRGLALLHEYRVLGRTYSSVVDRVTAGNERKMNGSRRRHGSSISFEGGVYLESTAMTRAWVTQ